MELEKEAMQVSDGHGEHASTDFSKDQIDEPNGTDGATGWTIADKQPDEYPCIKELVSQMSLLYTTTLALFEKTRYGLQKEYHETATSCINITTSVPSKFQIYC